ncbi:DUF600 domain-containing protein [Bacillus infantis]|uniref:hypothetical protein n=1 Tax=Bacillus infantis TaxID=324767 RepID=UPI000B9BFB0D|nr:hypothetical protein [Bacillus infantis]MCK6207117.1 DUF600 domain-containing protein [Bacillus infantis]OXT15111.1 hypothetical protein B9K06_22645 [Bacillus sp. OG2]
MTKVFEGYFTEIQADMVALCLEYSGKVVDDIYIYGSIEPSVVSFNVFYKIGTELVRTNGINSILSEQEKIDDSRDKQMSVLKIGVQDLMRIQKLCQDYHREVPTEMKIHYDVKQNSMTADYQYELVHSNTDDKTAGDIFVEWYEKERNKLNNGD